MKSSLNRTANVISGLVQKCVVINNKIKQNILNQQNYQQLKNRLNDLENMFSDNNDSIKPEIIVTTPVTLTGTQNTAITDIQLAATVSDGGQPLFTSSDLPEGLTLSSTGLITGTPTVSGTGSSSITVSYTGAESKTITLNWTIEATEDEPETTVQTYVVSGAGWNCANGEYTLDESLHSGTDGNGKVYRHGGNDGFTYYLYKYDFIWGINWENNSGYTVPPDGGAEGGVGALYYSSDDSATSDWFIKSGTSPAPTVVEVSAYER